MAGLGEVMWWWCIERHDPADGHSFTVSRDSVLGCYLILGRGPQMATIAGEGHDDFLPTSTFFLLVVEGSLCGLPQGYPVAAHGGR